MSKRKRKAAYAADTEFKDTVIFYAMPIIAWAMLAGLVVVMVYVTG